MANQNQDVSVKGKGLQGGRDAIDNSINDNRVINKFYGSENEKDDIDYDIITAIFKFLVEPSREVKYDPDKNKLTRLKKKIGINFNDESVSDVEGLFTKLWHNKELVEKYVENEADPDEIDGLVLKLQERFRKLRGSDTHQSEVREVNILTEMASQCVPERKKKDSRYVLNSLAIILYFFEKCDFGQKTVDEKKLIQTVFNI
jgi:hypothetical protein